MASSPEQGEAGAFDAQALLVGFVEMQHGRFVEHLQPFSWLEAGAWEVVVELGEFPWTRAGLPHSMKVSA